MAQPNPQLRINQLAKDLSVKSKDILDIFEAAGLEGKTHMATLTPDEFGLLIWTLTESRQVSNIDDYLDGIIKIKTKAQNAAEKAAKEAEEKAKREQEEKEAEARKIATTAEKTQAAKALEESYAAQQAAETARAALEKARLEADILVKAEIASVIFEMSLRVYDFEPPPLDMVAEA